jgi:uncharacterized Zn-binding protein involved in type VI secretion
MPPAARITDNHVSPSSYGSPAPILPPGEPTVLIGGLPAARATDMVTATAIPVDMISMGSTTVMIGGLPAARMTDPTASGGMIIGGEFTVMIG